MNNLECAIAVLAHHRAQFGGWDDRDVAADLLGRLGLDPSAPAANPNAVYVPAEEAPDVGSGR